MCNNDDICHQVETETQTVGTIEATTNNTVTHPIKRKLSLAFKYARRAFRVPRKGRKGQQNITISTLN